MKSSNQEGSEEVVLSPTAEEEVRDANACMAVGGGVGALGVGASVVLGATCPLCYVIAPALVFAGAHKRRKARKKLSLSGEN